MPSDRFYESDPDEKLSRDLINIRELAEAHSPLLWSQSSQVQEAIERGLASDYHYDRAAEAIFSMIGFATSELTTQSWFEPIVDLVGQHPVSEGKVFEVGFSEVTHTFRDFVGVYAALNTVRITVVDDLLQAYIRLIKLLAYKPTLKVSDALFDQALSVGRRLDDHIESAKLQQTLALYYAHHNDFDAAESCALLAFTDSEYIDDPGGIADAACTLAIVYRSGHRFKRAEYYIKRAIDKVPSGKLDKRYATLFYEYAINWYRKDKFELALSYYRQALSIYEEYEAVYQIAMTKQAMAQSYLYLGEFGQAEDCLSFARSAWDKLGNRYEYVNTFFVEADLELKRGNRGLALRMLHQTIDKANELADPPARQGLIDLIQEHIEKYFGIDR